jgi:hypothetical protein
VWNEPDSVLLNMNSYLRKQDHLVQSIQRAAATLNSLIFVGVGEGSRDPDLGPLIEWLSHVSRDSEYTHYRLCLSSELEAVRKQHSYHNIEVVPYGAEHTQLADFLALLESPETIRIDPPSLADRPTPTLGDLDDGLLRAYSKSQGLANADIDQHLLALLHLTDAAERLFAWAVQCFAREPSLFFPGSTIKIVDVESKHTLSVDGPVARQLAECMTTFRNLVHLPHLSGAEREQFLVVAREVLSNAITHRDYGSAEPIHVARSPEGLVVTSPGRLRSRSREDEPLLGKSQPPHPYRARVLHYLGTAEGAGLGDLVLREFRSAILPAHPTSDVRVAEEQGRVVVTLRVPPPSRENHDDAGLPPSEDVAGVETTTPAVEPPPGEPVPAGETTPSGNGAPSELAPWPVVVAARAEPAPVPPAARGAAAAGPVPTAPRLPEGISAKDVLVVPLEVRPGDAPKGWGRAHRDSSLRSLDEALSVRPLRAVVSAGPFRTDDVVALVLNHLAQQGVPAALVTDHDLDDNRVGQVAGDDGQVLVIATAEPIRAYYPAAESADSFVIVTRARISATPISMEALLWSADTLREDAKYQLMTPTARGELRADPEAAEVILQLALTPGDVDLLNSAVKPYGEGSSLVPMLRSLEHNALRIGLDLGRLRAVLNAAYPWAYRPTDTLAITRAALDQWLGRRNRVYVWAILLASVVLAVAVATLAWNTKDFDRAEWA